LRRWLHAAIAGAALAGSQAGAAAETTILHHGATTRLVQARRTAGELWVRLPDLERITGFELKPQGACREDVCVPVKQRGEGALVRTERGEKWFHLTGFARKLGQAWVHDVDLDVWSFGEIPVLRGGFLTGGMAPDFALDDRRGRAVRLSGFRGKKVLLLTWASW